VILAAKGPIGAITKSNAQQRLEGQVHVEDQPGKIEYISEKHENVAVETEFSLCLKSFVPYYE
jgi:hypothetical protein